MAPTVLDGVQALHAAAEEGPRSQGASGFEGGIVKPPPLAGAGHQVGAAQGGRHQKGGSR